MSEIKETELEKDLKPHKLSPLRQSSADIGKLRSTMEKK